MLLNTENTSGKKVEIYDCAGSRINGVLSFDTETGEIEMVVYLAAREGDRVRPILRQKLPDGSTSILVAKFKVPGAFAIIDGSRI